MSRGTLYVISAPSGAGKTTILRRVMEMVPGLSFSVSHTTRKPRKGEQDGRDYHFISREHFQKMKDDGLFLEWAEVHGNLYGTSKLAVEEHLAQGEDIILDIDVQGAQQVREALGPKAVFLFILPPSLVELERRLNGRGTDSPETINLRLNNARLEMSDADLYDHVIINDTVERAVEMVKAIVLAERSKRRRDADGRPLVFPDFS